MNRIYSAPLRVYLILGALALAGIYAGFSLPISLFPNSSKPEMYAGFNYGHSTAEEFLSLYGQNFEEQLQAIAVGTSRVEHIEAFYGRSSVTYKIDFNWGTDPKLAEREVDNAIHSFAARLPEDIRESGWSGSDKDSLGFIAITFFSDRRSIDEVYELIEPLLMPKVSQVKDADLPGLWNPNRREIRIEMKPQVMASLQLFPRDIRSAVSQGLSSRGGGSLTMGTRQMPLQMPRATQSIEDLQNLPLFTPSGRLVHLNDVAQIDFGPKSNDNRAVKTSGMASIILYANPKAGGNIKRMAEEIIAIVEQTAPSFPPDIHYKVLVDPSEFIRGAITNVFHEVAIGAMLAVLVLFLFIGSFKNVATAAIEIPMSMVLAFLLMKMSGMNINLISLGGLALSAGMNVDASVVVMENIFRHFEMYTGPRDFQSRLKVITTAVREVWLPVIGSTIASLVVFLPLTFTSDLSYAILGDLAKAVVFSHGFSAFVALLLVPTVRLQLMGTEKSKPHASPLENQLRWLESFYGKMLERFMNLPLLKWGSYAGLVAVLVVLGYFVIPNLPKEVIGVPDTDWVTLNLKTEGNTLSKQMENQTEVVEGDLLKEFGDKIQYTFTQIRRANDATIMARLRDKKDMKDMVSALETRFSNSPTMKFAVFPWNPSELPLPDPPQLLLNIHGSDRDAQARYAQEVMEFIESKHLYHRLYSKPEVEVERGVFFTPHAEQWSALQLKGLRPNPGDLMDMVKAAVNGDRIANMPVKGDETPIILRYPPKQVETIEDIAGLPIGIDGRLLPLKAMMHIGAKAEGHSILRLDQREVYDIYGRLKSEETMRGDAVLKETKKIMAAWQKDHPAPSGVSLTFEDASIDLTSAINQLATAVGLSIVFIFLVMVLQFGSVIEPLLVLVAVPLGFIGVLASLYIFGSTLSLNSILGVILLNGIAVANSIILVDFIKRSVESGLSPREAAVEAARKRLRPILITSLTTVLGMLPIALGFGEGGRILQPLGIAVSGGLWISMLLTLFLVPALQVTYLEWRLKRRRPVDAEVPLGLTPHGSAT